MGHSQSFLVSYDDVQFAQKHPDHFLLLNTLPTENQQCVISTTIPADKETDIMNELLHSSRGMHIIVYGRNDHDESVPKKLNQLKKLGFRNVFMYPAGMFEWLMLQEIYGCENFETTGAGEILDFQPALTLKRQLDFVYT
jgi:hypothetical protein